MVCIQTRNQFVLCSKSAFLLQKLNFVGKSHFLVVLEMAALLFFFKNHVVALPNTFCKTKLRTWRYES